MLNDQEQNAILSALHSLYDLETTDTENVLQKLSAIFKKPAINWVEVDYSGWGFVDKVFFNIFKTAIIEHRIVEFDYDSIVGEKKQRRTHRRIEPIRLWFNSQAWYVKGFCLHRQEMRLFKLTRIENLTISNERFLERDPSSIVSDTDLNVPIKKDVTLKLKIEKEMSHRVYDEFREECAEKQPDGSFVISVSWPEDEWVYGTILSFGEYIEVLEPEHIRESIRKKIEKISKKYLF
jgi:predicted DNA-binding transcriptional regulator YafY